LGVLLKVLEGVAVFSFPFFPKVGVFGVLGDFVAFCRGMVEGRVFKQHME